jgi:hypothetical protein
MTKEKKGLTHIIQVRDKKTIFLPPDLRIRGGSIPGTYHEAGKISTHFYHLEPIGLDRIKYKHQRKLRWLEQSLKRYRNNKYLFEPTDFFVRPLVQFWCNLLAQTGRRSHIGRVFILCGSGSTFFHPPVRAARITGQYYFRINFISNASSVHYR